MTFNEKKSLALRLIYEDYSKIITPSAGAIYYKLLLINKQLFDVKPHIQSISFETIASQMKVSLDELATSIKLLDALGWVEKLARKDAVYVHPPKELTYEESVSLIESLVEKRIIEQDQKQSHIDAIRIPVEKPPKVEVQKAKDYDFENAKRAAYSWPQAMLVVEHYYEKLGQEFGGHFASPYKTREAQMMKVQMNKFGDSPETTIKMLDYMIERAKISGNFAQVTNMGSYSWRRNLIFQKVFPGKSGVESKPVTQKDKMNSMKTLFDVYTEDGMSHAEAINELRMVFGDEFTKQFEEGLHGEQISLHQKTV